MAGEIAPATPADAGDIARVLAAAFASLRHRYTPDGFAATVVPPEAVERRMEEGPVWVVRVGDRIVGTAALVIDGADGYLRGMAVDPHYRGQGIGRRLLEVIEAHAFAQGLRRVWLYSTPFLTDAIRLYGAAGFTEITGGASDLHGTPLIAMEKHID